MRLPAIKDPPLWIYAQSFPRHQFTLPTLGSESSVSNEFELSLLLYRYLSRFDSVINSARPVTKRSFADLSSHHLGASPKTRTALPIQFQLLSAPVQ